MAEDGDENIETYIEDSHALIIEYLLDIKEQKLDMKMAHLKTLEQKCLTKNYIASFKLNYKLAKLR